MKWNHLSWEIGRWALGLAAVITLVAGPARATITVLDYWRMGENDPGAAAGVTATSLIDSVGPHNLVGSGPALYSTDVAATALAHTGSFFSVGFTNSAFASNSIVSTAQDNFGIEAWVKPVSVTNGQVIAYNGSTATSGWGIMVSGTNYLGLFGGKDIFGTNTAIANVWAHVALVRSNGVATIYVNGVAAGTSGVIPNLPAGNFAVAAPPQSPTSQFLTGWVDEVRVFTFAAGQFSTNDLLFNSGPPQSIAAVATTAASSVTGTTATLNGLANPGGLVTSTWFDWGNIPGYGHSTSPVSIGSGFTLVAISNGISGLQAGQAYHFRASASNALGRAISWDKPFVSPRLTLNGGGFYTSALGVAFTNPVASLTAIPLAIGQGQFHSLVLKADGTVAAWGYNTYNQTNVPPGLSNVVAISAGLYFSLALKADGTVAAWGDNTYNESIVPPGLNNIVGVAAGAGYALVLNANGTVVGWGVNNIGQATPPPGLNSVVAISAGGGHTLALRADGTVVAWGYNSNGQTNVPPGLSNVVAVAAGTVHSLALKADSTVVGWGDNLFGEINVGGLTNVVAIAAGGYDSLALKANGTVVIWGDNSVGELNVPPGLTNVVAIGTGGPNVMAMKGDGTVVVWGGNYPDQYVIPAGLTNLSGTATVSGTVNTNVAGTYLLTYTTTNFLGAVGSVTGTVVVSGPVLQIHPVGPGLATVSWTPATTGYALQQRTNLSLGSWSNSVSGPTNPVTVGITNAKTFYRLIHP